MAFILEMENLSKSFGDSPVLAGFSLQVRDNEYMTLLGPSGCGKSTLLRVLAGFERPESGDVRFEGQSIVRMPPHERGIGFVSQGFALFPHMSVFDNVAFGLRNRRINPVRDEAETRRQVEAILDLVGLADLGGREIGQISGGQKQRVTLARTLVTRPKVILLDEPLGALDANLRSHMTLELRRIRRQLGITFMHVTGNEMEALAMGDRVVVMDAGRAVQVADSETVYNRPATPRVARFLNCYNSFQGRFAPDGRLVVGQEALDCPADAGPRQGEGTYCVRFDRVQVAAADAPLPAGQTGVVANYITSEYSGARLTHFFGRSEGQVLEAERHMSDHRPEEYVAGRPYRLNWRAAEALVYS